jgi:hypothetical protein
VNGFVVDETGAKPIRHVELGQPRQDWPH